MATPLSIPSAYYHIFYKRIWFIVSHRGAVNLFDNNIINSQNGLEQICLIYCWIPHMVNGGMVQTLANLCL